MATVLGGSDRAREEMRASRGSTGVRVSSLGVDPGTVQRISRPFSEACELVR
jgi:hypothetical protein